MSKSIKLFKLMRTSCIEVKRTKNFWTHSGAKGIWLIGENVNMNIVDIFSSTQITSWLEEKNLEYIVK